MQDSAVVTCLCRIFAVMQHAYPREFRERYGLEMRQVFRDRCRAIEQTGGFAALLRFGALTVSDWFLTTIREGIACMSSSAPFKIRFMLLVGVGLSLTMMGIEALLYRPLFAMPGGSAYVLETTVVFLLYGTLVVWATRSTGPSIRTAFLLATPMGVIAAALQVAHLAAEDLAHLSGPWQGAVSIAFELGTFLIWGLAGYRSARSARAITPGILAGAWSAIVTMSLFVGFGFAVEFFLAMPKPEYVATWGEFKRSGWPDVHAFTIANTLDAALSHLIAGPIVGAIFGGVAGAAARLLRSGNNRTDARTVLARNS